MTVRPSARRGTRTRVLVALPAIGLIGLVACTPAAPPVNDGGFTTEYPVSKAELAPTGRNPYFILEPGYRTVFEGGGEQLTITVLDETKQVDGVQTRVLEEREVKGGELAEVSRNYFAINNGTGDVYYFGEDVDIYRGGQVANHDGSWLSGESGARFGLIMPGTPQVGNRHYQEIAPGVALDRAEVISVTEQVRTAAGQFSGCVRVRETTQLEPGTVGFKSYAPGVGLIQDGSLNLVQYSGR